MTTKRLYLDVDGVLNAFPYKTGLEMLDGTFDYANPWGDDWQRGEARGYIITWSPALVTALNEALAHSDGPELHWTTTWQDNAPEFIRPLLGIEVDPEREFVVYNPQFRPSGASIGWKMPQIKHRIEQLRDLGHEPGEWVHIDDEFQTLESSWYNTQQWSDGAGADKGLVIGPDPTFGITPENWDAAKAHWGIS